MAGRSIWRLRAGSCRCEMDVKVAMVYVDEEHWLDRQIAQLRGGQKYSHGALIVYPDHLEPLWWDTHWRWFVSDLRCIPAKNYTWRYSLWDIKGLTEEEAKVISAWLLSLETRRINYDLFSCLGVKLADMLGLQKNPLTARSALFCFELISEALKLIGRGLPFEETLVLGTDITESGLLKQVTGV